METDCTERMCRVRLARNRESNWANEFLARALSCNYTLTCLTILLPLNPAVFQERVYPQLLPALFRHTDLMHRNTAPLHGNFTQSPIGFSNFDKFFTYYYYYYFSTSDFSSSTSFSSSSFSSSSSSSSSSSAYVLHMDACLMMTRLMQPIIALTICE